MTLPIPQVCLRGGRVLEQQSLVQKGYQVKNFPLRGFAHKFLFESSKQGLNLEKTVVDKGCQNELISLTFLIMTIQ